MTATVRLSSKGQLTLPVAVREQLGLEQGDALELTVQDGQLLLSPVGRFEDITSDVMTMIKPGTTPITDVAGYYAEHRLA
ncbi:MAG TPA: AbrB/MazE/SpoVT family DNA-binding domain-containing protein [Arachnia sp.]|nr:AbrB/MazE/SpoVT family DNA-binding domain-containing protein [Arachnia sp.]HMT87925.1 AbrB/MazE/SpoVT family DNA-binding domain-containing protein [Arachnia sp.]